MQCVVYASVYPEDALLRSSVAEKRARHRKLGQTEIVVQEDGSATVDPRPFEGALREGEALTVRYGDITCLTMPFEERAP